MRKTFANIIGKTVLAGLTYKDAQGNVVHQAQFSGQITAADPQEGLSVRVEGQAEDFMLPPDLKALRAAEKGQYRLHSTGEVIVDPDYICLYTIHAPE